MPDLVHPPNFHVFFHFLATLYEFDQFWVFWLPGGTCDVTNRLKFDNCENSDIIFGFPVPKLVSPPNFKVQFHFFRKLLAFDHISVFLRLGGLCDVIDPKISHISKSLHF